jgi:uncharacterized protein (TIGR00270 family)
MRCDLCGKEGDLYKTLIEGTELNVCEGCSSFGKVLNKITQQREVKKRKQPVFDEVREESKVYEFVKEDIGTLVKNKRERLGLKQGELAKKMAVKESLIHNIESGHFKPSIGLAKKISKFLSLDLIERIKEKKIEKKKNIDDRELTLGDLIKIKKRKK